MGLQKVNGTTTSILLPNESVTGITNSILTTLTTVHGEFLGVKNW